jgi:hypothetical protein
MPVGVDDVEQGKPLLCQEAADLVHGAAVDCHGGLGPVDQVGEIICRVAELGYSKHQQEDPFLKRVWRRYSIRKGEREGRRKPAISKGGD